MEERRKMMQANVKIIGTEDNHISVYWNPSEAKKILRDARRSGVYIPKRFELFYKELISHLDEEASTGVTTAKA